MTRARMILTRHEPGGLNITRSIGAYCLLLTLFIYHPVSSAENQPLFDLQGNERTLSEFRGKWVVVNYWATWCAPCLEEIPELSRFHAAHNESDAVVLGVNMEAFDAHALRVFMEEQGINYPIWTSTASQQTLLGPVSGLPTSFLLSPQGEVVARQVGVVSAQMIERFIQRQMVLNKGGDGKTRPANSTR